MGVSALRVVVGACVLAGGLVLGGSAAALASADPGDGGRGHRDAESSKGVNGERAGLSRVIDRIFSDHRTRSRGAPRRVPRAKIGSEPDSDPKASEPGVAVGAAPAVEKEKPPSDSRGHPFPYYLLEFRRGGGDWWNADRINSRRGDAVTPFVATKPEPEPEPVPGPAFRGPVRQAPAADPEPVIDASGGIAAGGGGSDYRDAGFGGSPVLSAPVVAIPMPPPAAARFPAFPPAAAPGPGAAAARGGVAEPTVTAHAVRQAGTPEQAPANAVKSTLVQAPRQGYTDYLRGPGLPRLAAAALPGVAGILLMTFGGAVVGYRQADAGRMIRSSAAARYLP